MDIQLSAPPVVTIQAVGTQGPPGGGGSGSSYYLHTQTSPAAVWQVTHNLDRTPNVSVIRTDGTVAYADIDHASTSLAVITFPTAIAGTAMCS